MFAEKTRNYDIAMPSSARAGRKAAGAAFFSTLQVSY
jgi:hypothetical protein